MKPSILASPAPAKPTGRPTVVTSEISVGPAVRNTRVRVVVTELPATDIGSWPQL